MAGNPRENTKDKGFWDGGAPGNEKNGNTGGRPSGYPGIRKAKRTGVRTDLEFPETPDTSKPQRPS